jgi:hypothetical protein
MKTAMQELIFHIAYMERVKYQDEQTKIIGGMNECIMNDAIVIQNRIIEELTKEYAEYLEKEKEQIIDAYDKGSDVNDDLKPLYGTPEEYYNQTYNQKQLIIDIMKADEDDGLYKMSEEEIRDWHMIQSLKEKYGE